MERTVASQQERPLGMSVRANVVCVSGRLVTCPGWVRGTSRHQWVESGSDQMLFIVVLNTLRICH